MHQDTCLPPELAKAKAGTGAEPAHRLALEASMRFLALVQTWGLPAAMAQAETQVGQCLLQVQAVELAETYFARALQWAATLAAVDSQVDLRCTLAELNARQACALGVEGAKGRACLERAREHALAAAALAGHVSDVQWEMRVLLRISEVLENCGDHHDAVRLQDRAVALLGLQAAGAGAEFSALPMLTAPGQLM